MQTLKKKHFKILALSSLGGTLEFYDFIIFVFFAAYISKNFFPENLSEFWKLFNTYGIFAAGYLARPLGGIIMAHFGDKFGRKNMFMLSILLMVIPTFALAFIPSFESLGYACIVLLVCVRILQGVAIGGELPGAWIFTYEHAPHHQRHTYLGVLTASVTGGILLGSLVFLFMNKIFSQEELYEWAWRVPFFLGGIFGIISVYLRKFLSETPVFEQMKKEQNLEKFPLKEVFKRAKLSVVCSMLITWVLTGCIVVLILLLPNYMGSMLQIDKIEQSYLQMLGIVSICFGCVFSGFLGDKIGVVKTCVLFALGLIIFNLIYFNALYMQNSSFEDVAKWYLLACFFGGIMNLCPMIMSEIFDAKIKFSGLSLGYNLAYALAGGFTPQLAFFLHTFALQNLDNALRFSLGFYILLLGLVAFYAALMYKKLAKF
ncbi:MFS transporter [Campylobacter helveticus]|uniref:MHS family MFS transporter n=1 Tax=Campylobacter helveticus TaxID=28898 RepID=A0AAX2UIR8_9BACT|nr:MFS transporter [Campylobacter helveticus]MCR2056770.1 MFS transporter [Campylobacter helveticus]TNB57342.1 MHS family MFS transporter [Campylobacter helveticus]TNB61846.1 MHS family MFS transporter [Campylobacter helveticus]